MNTTQIFLGVIFSSIGLGYFLYGKKQKMTVPFTVGLVLMIFPYFIESNVLLSGIGTLLSVISYFFAFRVIS
ncbi:amino acid transport protein [Acinetobacter baumannii]|uniref:amino acid transport protein n=1 Tax=Acinetobacter baumannii TaxID=470 RepID=UPI003B42CD64